MLEVAGDGRSTHVVLVDDDVRIAPESILRMHAFFSLAHESVALGGHMLDAVQPCMLYEAGATVDGNDWSLYPMRSGQDLRCPETLAELLDVQPLHYSGWWLFGFPVRFLEQVGMPLPCFIRGDDVEFGLRLHEHGLHTVTLPGVAIWHEPFYLKIGGWQLYYETRNMLIAAALHFDFRPARAARVVAAQCLTHLLTFRYYSAALILRGAVDFLRGPAILATPPLQIHAGLTNLRGQFPAATVAREHAHTPARVAPPVRGGAKTALVGAYAIARNWLAPTRSQTTGRRIAVRDLAWMRVRHADALAVDTYWDRDLIVLRRSRPLFRRLFGQLATLSLRLLRESPERVAAWQRGFPTLRSRDAWATYLGLPPGG